MRLALAIATTLLLTAPAAAQQRRPAEATARFWREVNEPGLRRAEALLRQARSKRQEIDRPTSYGVRTDPVVRLAAFEAAKERLLRANALAPNNAEITYQLARCYSDLADRRPDHPPTDREAARESIRWLERTREIDPEYESAGVWFDIAINRSRLHDWAGAAEAYQLSLDLLFDQRDASIHLANLAEMRMLAGDLHGAVRDYQRALEIAGAAPTDLIHWGLAVSLDRLGEHDAAIAHAWLAMGQRNNTMAALTEPWVFFEPPHELHYYEALGHLALAEHDDPPNRDRHLTNAVASFIEFLQNGGADGPFGASARHRLDQARTALAPPQERARRGRRRAVTAEGPRAGSY